MATLEQLEEGIRRAHAAGNAEHVRALGQAYRAMQSQASKPAPAGPTIKVGDRVIPVSEYQAMSNEERQAIRDQIAQANPSVQTQSSWIDPLAQGMTLGWGDEIASAAHGGLAALQGGDFGSTYAQAKDHYDTSLGHERRVNPVGSFAAEVGGAVLPSVLSGGAGLLAQGTSTLGRAVAGGLAGLTQGVVYGAGASEADDVGGRAQDAMLSGLLGAGLGGAAPYVGQGLRRLVTPFPASAANTQAAQTLAREGVELTAGQQTGRKGLQYLESELGGGAAADLMERQAEQFTAAALSRAGIAAPRATPEVIDNAFTTIGRQFDGMAAMTDTPFDQTLQSNLATVVRDYLDTSEAVAPVVQRMLTRLVDVARNSGMRLTGRSYQDFRSELGRLIQRSKGSTQDALRDMQEALDDAIERNISGDTLAAWQAIRRQYRNLLVIEKAATGAGAGAAAGLLSPAQLRNAAIQKGRRSFARGTSDFTDLANAGVQALTPLPQSGTAPRLAARGLSALPAVIGAAAGSPGGVPGAILGSMVGAAVPAAIGRAALSRPGRALLANQRATGTDASAAERLLQTLRTPLVGQR